MAVTRFESIISTQSLGTADVDKLASSFDKLSGSIDASVAKAGKVNEHPGFGAFAEKVKQGIENPLQALGGAAESALQAIGPLGAGLATGGAIFGAFTTAAMAAAKSLGEYGHQIEDAGIRTGLTVKEVGQFTFAAKMAGQDIGIFEGAMRKLSQGISGGDVGVLGGLRKLKVETKDATGELRASSQIFYDIGAALEKLPTAFDRNASAVKIFGKQGAELVPTLVELNANVTRARELGLGASEEDVQRWMKYHGAMVEIGAQWEKLKRQVAEPLAATIMFFLKDGSGKQYTFDELRQRGVNLGSWDRTEYGAQQAAKAAGFGLAAEWNKNITLSNVSDYTNRIEQKKSDDALDQRVHDHVRRLNEQMEAARKMSKELDSFEKQMYERGMDPIERIFSQRDQFTGAFRGPATDAALVAASAELKKLEAQANKQSMDKIAKATEHNQQAFDDYFKPLVEEGLKSNTRYVQQFLKWNAEMERVATEIQKIQTGSERSEIMARSGKTMAMADLAAGPGGEGKAVAAAYQERLGLAQRLYDFEMEHAATRVDQVKAEADLHKSLYEADIEHELKIAELQHARIEKLRGEAGAFFDAMLGGTKGIEQFAKSTVEGWGRTIFSNVVTDIAGHKPLDRATIFGGTPFASDPLKDATFANTVATLDNTRALRERALSPSGGGGSLGAYAQQAMSGTPSGIYDLPSKNWALDPMLLPGMGVAPSTSFPWAKALGAGGAVAGGAFGIYSGLHAGGAQGDLTAAGSGIAMIGALASLSKGLGNLGPIGMAVGAGLGMVSMLLGDPKKNRAAALDTEAQSRRFDMPTGTDYSSDVYGRQINYDYMGRSRPIVVNNYVNALDVGSFHDYLQRNPAPLAAGMSSAISGGNAEDLVGTLRNVL